ncbi:dispanin subfamily A member 2b-like [Scleropages formosus]|uniref:Dispanin subfamily A member 2b-like n=1 Tax=Scleropages formosus TaxID=113540 RepID=A0A8C9SZD6_SCLFO|nr:dispanin subfamily A member 2b-like [Scleropages formosus]
MANQHFQPYLQPHFQPEFIPLQVGACIPPGGPGEIQTVAPTPVRDYIVWSLCSFVYLNPCCLGLAALIYSIKARDRKFIGDLEGAQMYQSKAHCFNCCALCMSLILGVGLILLVATGTLSFKFLVNLRI